MKSIDRMKLDPKKLFNKDETLKMLDDEGKVNMMIGDINKGKLLASAIYWIKNKEE